MATIPDFTKVSLSGGEAPRGGDGLSDWAKRFERETGKSPEHFLW